MAGVLGGLVACWSYAKNVRSGRAVMAWLGCVGPALEGSRKVYDDGGSYLALW